MPKLNPSHNGRPRKADILTAAEKPPAMQVRWKKIPRELRKRTQWVCWRWVRREKQKGGWTWTKVPIDPKSGRRAKVDDPETWGTFQQARNYYQAHELDGLGFVFTAHDPYCGIDLDDCRDPISRAIDPWARRIIDNLDSYAELSPTRTGLKVFVRAKKPGEKCTVAYETGQVEIYDRKKFFTVTGWRVP